MKTINVPEAHAQIHVVRTMADVGHMVDWVHGRDGAVSGLDIETNAVYQYSPGFRTRTVQVADETQAFVIVTDMDEAMECAAADVLRGHPAWVAHFAENDIAFAHKGLKTTLGHSPIKLGDELPHVADSQVPLAMWDPRTVSTRKGIDPRIPRLKGLKDNSRRLIGPALSDAEARLHARFKELAPTGHKTDAASKTWGFANIPNDDEAYLVYAGLDAIDGLRLFNLCRRGLEAEGRWGRCMAALTEQWMIDQASIPGMQVDAEYALWLQQEFQNLLESNAKLLATYDIGEKAAGPAVGHAFKSRYIDSPVRKRNDHGEEVESWDKNAMAALMEHEHPKVAELAQTISSTRRAAKFKAAYVDPMVRAVLFADGAMHASTRAIGTVTTRMSAQKTPSAGPVQQLPKKDTRIRAAVRARRGHVLVTADFEQGEPFTMAALSGDEAYLADLEAGDINSRIAELVYGAVNDLMSETGLYDRRFGKTAGTVHYLMRQNAKAGWLAACYGCQAAKLWETLLMNMPVDVKLHMAEGGLSGQSILDTWRATYPKLWALSDHLNTLPYVQLDSGHRVPLWDRFGVAQDGRLFLRDRPSRKGLNAASQGTQADLLKLAMHRLNAWGWSWAFRFALHDELMLEVPVHMAEEARAVLEAAMTITYRGVTLRCDAVIEGDRWMARPTEFDTRLSDLDELEDEE